MLVQLKEIIKQIIYYPKLKFDDTNYDEYWRNKRKDNLGFSNGWQKQRADWILEKVNENETILDLGCGDGGVLLYMKQKKDINIIGADISDVVIKFLNSKNVQVIKFDIKNFDAIEELPEVDHIMILEVLEHISNPEKFLKKILTKANKSIFFSFPNTGYISYRLRLLFGAFPVQWNTHPGEHIRFWTYRDLKWWLSELKLKQHSKIHIYEGLPFLNKIWPGLFGAGFIVEIKK